MKKTKGVAALIFALMVGQAGQLALAEDAVGDPRLARAQAAIAAGQNIQAVQLLTAIANSTSPSAQRAQELLGNVREQNGQLAHALAEYRTYLQKYPTGEGADRVKARIAALENAPPASPAPPQANTSQAKSPAQSSTSFSRAARTGPPAPPPEPMVMAFGSRYTVKDRGRISLVYRYNETASQFTDLSPTPDPLEDPEFFFDNALTAGLYFGRVYENDQRRIEFKFNGSLDLDIDDFDDSNLRLYEASVAVEDKPSGRSLTFGRLRLKPYGIAYRMDGLWYRTPLSAGPVLGFFAGTAVNSTRDALFSSGQFLFGASAEWEDFGGRRGDLTLYLVEQRYQGHTDRRALGFEYDFDLENGSLLANAEYDIKLGAINRVLLTGTMRFANNAQLTGRASYFRSPGLMLRNALIGQTQTTLDGLALTEAELEALALDRAAEVTTLGATYYNQLNDTWSMSLDGTLYYTGGTPASAASGGANAVAAVPADGLRTYFGVNFYGSSVFRDRDQVNFGLRGSTGDDSNLIVADGAIRLPVTEKLTIRPRLQVGYRTFTGGDEVFYVPSVNANYKFNQDTSFQLEAGGRWSERTDTSSSVSNSQIFVTAGFYRSF